MISELTPRHWQCCTDTAVPSRSRLLFRLRRPGPRVLVHATCLGTIPNRWPSCLAASAFLERNPASSRSANGSFHEHPMNAFSEQPSPHAHQQENLLEHHAHQPHIA